MLHAELIGLTGRAPSALDWKRPAVMETAAARHAALADMDVETEVPNVWQSGPMRVTSIPQALSGEEHAMRQSGP